MLNSVTIKNFKSLRNVSFQLKPITLLIGANNSGKSSFGSLLLTLKQTLASRNFESPFVLEGPYVRHGSYKDVVFAHQPKRDIEIQMQFRKPTRKEIYARRGIDQPRRRQLFNLAYFAPLTVSFAVGFDDKTETIQLRDLKVVHPDKRRSRDIIFEVKKRRVVNLFGERVSIPIEAETPREGKPITQKKRLYTTQRHFMLNVSMPREKDQTFFRQFALRRISNIIEEFFDESVLYLGPLREYPKRYYISSGEKPSDVGLRGERTVDFLYLHRAQIVERISYWLKKFKMAEEINVVKVAAGIWKVELVNLSTKISDNLKDVGFGVSQVLPIVTEGMVAQPGTTLIVEQPEIHLHPRAQAQLADLFIQLAKGNKYSIIETHSEHMILRFARRIAEGSLKKKDITIYEFKLQKNGTRVKELSFDNYGNLKEWPTEFFQTELEETMKHVRAQARRKRAE